MTSAGGRSSGNARRAEWHRLDHVAEHGGGSGNKRTAAVICEAFLMPNSMALLTSNVELYPVYFSFAEGSLDEAGFADWLRPHLLDTGVNVRVW